MAYFADVFELSTVRKVKFSLRKISPRTSRVVADEATLRGSVYYFTCHTPWKQTLDNSTEMIYNVMLQSKTVSLII